MKKLLSLLSFLALAFSLSSCNTFINFNHGDNGAGEYNNEIVDDETDPSGDSTAGENNSETVDDETDPGGDNTTEEDQTNTGDEYDGKEVMINAGEYPYLSTASTRFANSLEAGWNLGNSLDAHHDSVSPTSSFIDATQNNNYGYAELSTETCWGNPKVTYSLLKAVKDAGYTTIRIPVSWHQHVNKNNNFKITDQWMARVKTIVDYAMNLGFKVMLNTHHDIDPSFIYPTYQYLQNSKNFLTSVWNQISEVFGSYNTNLIYEGFNEPRLSKDQNEFDPNINTTEVNTCINELNQTFVNIIRSRELESEKKRFLVVKAYGDNAYSLIRNDNIKFSLPNDPSKRLIVSAHIYSPNEFAFKGTGGFNPNNKEDTNHIVYSLNELYKKYVKNGVGVVVGEWGSVANSYNYNDRLTHASYFVEQTYNRHIPCIYWDNGSLSGEAFALFNRQSEQNQFPEINNAINSFWGKDAKKYEVSYYAGSSLIYKSIIREGKNVVEPLLPWGYGYDGMYLDKDLNTPLPNNYKVNNDVSIYLSNYGVRPTNTLDSDNNWGPIDDKYISTTDGEWKLSSPGKGKNINYEMQVNFYLPSLNENTNYIVSFSYQIAADGANGLIYNDSTRKTVGEVISLLGDHNYHEAKIYFNSSEVTPGETRLSFNLSAIPSSCQSIDFILKNILIYSF